MGKEARLREGEIMEGGDVGWSKQERIKGNAAEKEDLFHWEEHSILVCVGDLEEPRSGVAVVLWWSHVPQLCFIYKCAVTSACRGHCLVVLPSRSL